MYLYSIVYVRNVRVKGQIITRGKRTKQDKDIQFTEYVVAESWPQVAEYWRRHTDDPDNQVLSMTRHDAPVVAILKSNPSL